MNANQRKELDAIKTQADALIEDQRAANVSLPARASVLGIGMVGDSHESRVLWTLDLKFDANMRATGQADYSTDLDGADVQPIGQNGWALQVRRTG
jgi:hypothetical protein